MNWGEMMSEERERLQRLAMSRAVDEQFRQKLLQMARAGGPLYQVLWEIVQKVAEDDAVFYGDDDDNYYCPFCNGVSSWRTVFSHDPDCIVTKACALVEQAKKLEGGKS